MSSRMEGRNYRVTYCAIDVSIFDTAMLAYIDGSLKKGKKSLSVAVNGPLIVDDLDLVIRAATDGVGLAYMSEENAAPHLSKGSLVRVLEDWCQPFPGFFLYYASRRQQPAALSALIDVLRM
jgi:DNA-binding transcriptional LysR family regulator